MREQLRILQSVVNGHLMPVVEAKNKPKGHPEWMSKEDMIREVEAAVHQLLGVLE